MAAEVGRRFRIIDHVVIPSAQPGRLGKNDLVITYQDEAMRTRMITVPYEQLAGKSDAEQLEIIRRAIAAAEAERAKFVGKEITL